jgi:mannose-6-phosphate isomerase-like protein (cupin superfamily)
MTERRFKIYRGADAPPVMERARSAPGTTPKPLPAAVAEGMERLNEAGWQNGVVTRVVVSMPHLQIIQLWYKSGFPLPLHSHDSDCFYLIIGGSARLGTETLRAGDGVFIPADVPYTFTPGGDGVEMIEVRTQDWFDTDFRTTKPDYWARTAELVRSLQPRWAGEPPPAGTMELEPAVTA